MKKIIALACTMLLLFVLASCNTGITVYESDVELLEDGPYCLEFKLTSDGEEPWEGVIAKKNDKYYLDLEGDTLILGEKESYILDTEDEAYAEYNSADLNYRFFDTMLDLDIQKKNGGDKDFSVICENENDRKVELYYTDNKLTKIEIYLYPESYGEMAATPMVVEVVSFARDIPKNVMFDIPGGYSEYRIHTELEQ